MKFQIIIVALLIGLIQSQKIVSLSTNFALTKEQINISEDLKSFTFRSAQKISTFILKNGQREDIVQKAVFISNVPHERLSVVRCGQLSKVDQRIDTSFGEKFEEFFAKRNFTLTISESDGECFGFNVLYQRNYQNLISEQLVEQHLNAFLNSTFSEIKNNVFQLALSTPFQIELNYNNKNKLNYIKIASSFDKFINGVQASIQVFLNNQFEVFKGSVRELQEFSYPKGFYVSYYSREALGTGLHQQSQIDIKIELKRDAIYNDGKNCELVIVDYLDNTQYVDIDEIYLHKNLNLTNYRVHDIERPSGLSPQHVYLLKYRFKEEDIEMSQKQDHIKLHMNETYLFHYRYRTPFEGQYKSSFMNTQVHFLLSCLKPQQESTLDMNISMAERMVGVAFNSTSFKQIKTIQVSEQNILERPIPVGNIGDKQFTLQVTIFLTVSVSLFFAYKILSVASKYKL